MIELNTLKQEREDLKKRLIEIDSEHKDLEGKMRSVRQREIQTKREIEALSVLIDLQESRAAQEEKQ